MKEKKKTARTNSLRTLVLFCSVVALLILGSLGLKFFSLIKASRFSSGNEFIMGFVYQHDLDVVALFPQENKLSHLQVRGITDLSQAKKTLGILLDGQITLQEPFAIDKTGDYLKDAALRHKIGRSTLSSYDLLRLSFAVKHVPANAVTTEEIRLPLSTAQLDQFSQELFTDPVFSEETKSVQILNGTGVPGLGTRLGRALSNRGVNVISIANTDDEHMTSEIRYYREKTATAKRLGEILAIPLVLQEKQGISDIIVIIGTDKKSDFE